MSCLRRPLPPPHPPPPRPPHPPTPPPLINRRRKKRRDDEYAMEQRSVTQFHAPARGLCRSQDFHSEPLVDPHDFGALETQAGHQTLLIESAGVYAAMNGIGGEAAGHPFVHDDDTGAGADLPAARVVYPIHRLL